MPWILPAPFTAAEDKLCDRLKKAGRFHTFSRTIRDRLFDDATLQHLIGMYTDGHHGKPPKVPSLVAMVLLLQAHARVSDEEAIRRVFMDKAWLLVLGWLEVPEAEIQLS